MVAVLDPQPVGVVGAEDERRGVDRALGSLAIKHGGQALGIERRPSHPAGRLLERLPGGLLGEQSKQHDSQEHVVRREIAGPWAVDDAADQILRDAI